MAGTAKTFYSLAVGMEKVYNNPTGEYRRVIDKPFLDERTNGLSYAAKYMKGSPLCWQVTLSAEECERSVLAMDAVKRL